MLCLRATTDSAWAVEAVKDLDAVLIDHAHCEMKAATNAMSLVVRHSSSLPLVRALTKLAREELDHFERVVAFLEARGLRLGPPPVDEYAAELRRAMHARKPTKGADELPHIVNRLLVGALIEARSCERFKLLLQALPANTPSDLRAFYEELFVAEARHYREYVDLAIAAAGPLAHRVEARLGELAEEEASIVRALASRESRGTVHG